MRALKRSPSPVVLPVGPAVVPAPEVGPNQVGVVRDPAGETAGLGAPARRLEIRP